MSPNIQRPQIYGVPKAQDHAKNEGPHLSFPRPGSSMGYTWSMDTGIAPNASNAINALKKSRTSKSKQTESSWPAKPPCMASPSIGLNPLPGGRLASRPGQLNFRVRQKAPGHREVLGSVSSSRRTTGTHGGWGRGRRGGSPNKPPLSF